MVASLDGFVEIFRRERRMPFVGCFGGPLLPSSTASHIIALWHVGVHDLEASQFQRTLLDGGRNLPFWTSCSLWRCSLGKGSQELGLS